MVNDPLVLRGPSKTCVPVVQFGKDIRVNYCAGGMNVSIAVANSQAIYDFSSYKDRSLAKFTPAGSSSRCRLNKCSRGGRTAFPIGLDHRRALHIENPGSRRYSTTPALNFKGWRPALGQHGNPTVYQHCIRRLFVFVRPTLQKKSCLELLPGMVVRRVIGFVLFYSTA